MHIKHLPALKLPDSPLTHVDKMSLQPKSRAERRLFSRLKEKHLKKKLSPLEASNDFTRNNKHLNHEMQSKLNVLEGRVKELREELVRRNVK